MFLDQFYQIRVEISYTNVISLQFSSKSAKIGLKFSKKHISVSTRSLPATSFL